MRDGLSEFFRGRRDERLKRIIRDLAQSGKPIRILDVGGRHAYWERVGLDFLRANNVTVDLLNVTEAEIGRGRNDSSGLITSLIGDATALDFDDNTYDLCHSNSVIEHVGDMDAMARFARETRRVARALFVQTPNYWFPVDPHFWRMPMFHWMPRGLRVVLLKTLPLSDRGKRIVQPGNAERLVDSVKMLSRGQFLRLYPGAKIETERFLGLAKSFIAVSVFSETGFKSKQ